MTDPIRAALERLISDIQSLSDSSLGIDGLHQNGDLAQWDELLEGGCYSSWLGDALAAARAALAEQQGELSPKELDHQPTLSADDIPPGPFSEHELREQWNQQADEFNQWDSLDSCEQLAWAQARAIQRDRNARQPARPAEGDGPRLCWTENMPPSESCRYDHCIAETPFGRFLITWKSWKKYDSPTVDETPWGDWYGAFNSIDAAKSSCQQEFNKRLARCGHQSTLSADDIPPAVTISALLHPAYEPGGSEADGAQLIDLEWWQPVMGCDSLQMVVDNARNILSSRWSSPAPMPVAKGDVGGLVAWLLEEAEQAANSDASHSAGMLTWAAQVVGEHAELLQQQQEQVKRLKDELADERMRLSACFRIAICDTPETAIRARYEYREHYWSPAAEAIAQKIDELIRLRKGFSDEADRLFYSLLNAVEALKRLRQWARLCGGRYNADVVLGVVDWIDGGMVGELPPIPAHALFTHEKS